MDKRTSLAEAADLIRDGDTLCLGGMLLHRVPSALVRQIARAGRKRLTLIKPSPAYDADLLCASGALRRVLSGIVTLEAGYGLAANYRRAIEQGLAGLTEHA